VLCRQTFPVHARFGRQEHIYRLSRLGAVRLAEIDHVPELPMFPTSAVYALDAPHRKATIDFRIRLDRSRHRHGFRVSVWENYFDMVGANHQKTKHHPLQARTRITFEDESFFIPDSVLVLTRKHHKLIVALEVVRGEKVTRTMNQISRHLQSVDEGALVRKYAPELRQDPLTLFLFERESLQQGIIDRLSSDPTFARYQRNVLFASIADTERDVVRCWRQVGDPKFLYDFITGKQAFRLSPPPS